MDYGVAEPDAEYWDRYGNPQRVKHDLIRHYLNGWLPKLILGGARRVVYFDTHAGRGRHRHGQLGSPLVALTTLLDHSCRERLLEHSEVRFIFIEENEDNLRELKEELGAQGALPRNIHVQMACRDCFKLLEGVVSSLKGGQRLAPSFVFCDPYGFSIPGATLRRLMGFPRVELFVNVMWREIDMAIKQRAKPGMAKRLDTLFDGPEWRQAIVSPDHDERAEQCVQLLRRQTGAKWPTYIRMLGKNDVTRNFLLHLTNHDAGRELMKECMWKACPDGGYYARKTDNPRQQYLITPQPDLEPLRRWVEARLSEKPRRWQDLVDEVRAQIWLAKHVNKVVKNMYYKEGAIIAEDYQGRFANKNNPQLRLTRRQ